MAAGVADAAPSISGSWAPPFDLPILGIHAVLLPTGKVMLFAYPDGDRSQNTAQVWLWNPAGGGVKRVDPPLWRDPADGQLKPANIWCGGQALLGDGRVLVVGGNLAYEQSRSYPYGYKGLNKTYTFNPFNETWTEQPEMRHGRWYPTTTLLADGTALILSGLDETGASPGNINPDVELFTPSSNLNGLGTLTRLPDASETPAPVASLYPHVFALPTGRQLVVDSWRGKSWHLIPQGVPSSTYRWSDVPDQSQARVYGSAVLLPEQSGGPYRVMEIGGAAGVSNSIATSTTEVLNDWAAPSGWQSKPSLNVPRSHHNSLLLPDGSMVTVGGGFGSVGGNLHAAGPEHRAVELWDPVSGLWRLGASQSETRAYHSTALLLPDGRVLSAGDDFNGGRDRDTGELYSPPYLFRGERPVITSAPSSVHWGETFTVATSDSIAKAVLIAPGATTHANDMSQRLYSMTPTSKPGGVGLTAPPHSRTMPPGYYMLFLVNNVGVPSVAKFVKVG